MFYDVKKRIIDSKRELSKLDELALSFTQILGKHINYVIISGYISILLGRARATEDIDLFIKKIDFLEFSQLYEDLKKAGFECINAEKAEEIFEYLKDGLAVRFSRQNIPVPNFEVKFPKRKIDEETFEDFIIVKLKQGDLKISSLERQIAFKRYYLKSEKDIEDAQHIEEVFENKIDYNKVNKLRKIIEKIEEDETRNSKI